MYTINIYIYTNRLHVVEIAHTAAEDRLKIVEQEKEKEKEGEKELFEVEFHLPPSTIHFTESMNVTSNIHPLPSTTNKNGLENARQNVQQHLQHPNNSITNYYAPRNKNKICNKTSQTSQMRTTLSQSPATVTLLQSNNSSPPTDLLNPEEWQWLEYGQVIDANKNTSRMNRSGPNFNTDNLLFSFSDIYPSSGEQSNSTASPTLSTIQSVLLSSLAKIAFHSDTDNATDTVNDTATADTVTDIVANTSRGEEMQDEDIQQIQQEMVVESNTTMETTLNTAIYKTPVDVNGNDTILKNKDSEVYLEYQYNIISKSYKDVSGFDENSMGEKESIVVGSEFVDVQMAGVVEGEEEGRDSEEEELIDEEVREEIERELEIVVEMEVVEREVEEEEQQDDIEITDEVIEECEVEKQSEVGIEEMEEMLEIDEWVEGDIEKEKEEVGIEDCKGEEEVSVGMEGEEVIEVIEEKMLEIGIEERDTEEFLAEKYEEEEEEQEGSGGEEGEYREELTEEEVEKGEEMRDGIDSVDQKLDAMTMKLEQAVCCIYYYLEKFTTSIRSNPSNPSSSSKPSLLSSYSKVLSVDEMLVMKAEAWR